MKHPRRTPDRARRAIPIEGFPAVVIASLQRARRKAIAVVQSALLVSVGNANTPPMR
jgi:hypothetical protein